MTGGEGNPTNHYRTTILAALLAMAVGCAEPVRLEGSWDAFDQPVSAEVWAGSERVASRLLAEFEGATALAESVLAAGPDTELARLNGQATQGYYSISNRDLYRCIRLALDYARASDGTFDPTIGAVSRLYAGGAMPPDGAELERALATVGWSRVVLEREALAVRLREPGSSLDLGGIAPGYAVDVAARNFARVGAEAGLIRLGNHVYAWGAPPGTDRWTVTVADPRDPARPFLELDVRSRAIAALASTPSDRVIDPATGKPVAGDVLAVVAVADSVADADAISGALLTGGSRRSGALLGKTHRVEAVLLLERDGERYLVASASLRDTMRVAAPLEQEIGGQVRFLLPPSESLAGNRRAFE